MQSQASQPAEDSRGKKKNRNKKKKGAAAEVRHVSGNEITGSPEAEEQNGSPQASTPVNGVEDLIETVPLEAIAAADGGQSKKENGSLGRDEHLADADRGSGSIGKEQEAELDSTYNDVSMKKSEHLERELASMRSSTTADSMKDEITRLKAYVSTLENDRETLQANKVRSSPLARTQDSSSDLKDAHDEIKRLTDENEKLETQYQNLLGKVSQIRSTLGERLKQDAQELEESRHRISFVEEQNKALEDSLTQMQSEFIAANEESQTLSRELSSLRLTSTTSQQSWTKEKERLLNAERNLREEADAMTRALRDWEMMASEERSARESMDERAQELEEQIQTRKIAYEKLLADKEREATTIDALKRALQDLQTTRKQELRDVVESMQTQLNEVTESRQQLEVRAVEAEKRLQETEDHLARVMPFEKDVKEKNLLIGKLRHEAVILNEHLTKALKLLKRGSAEETVDKQLVSNLLLSFLNIPRNDTKRYEVLRLMANFLNWNDEQREMAGLARPGSSSGSWAGSLSPSSLRRQASTPTLNSIDYFSSEKKESLAELWQEFLEKEASGDSHAQTAGRDST